MKCRPILMVALAVLLVCPAIAQQHGTIFVVRHAEKQSSPSPVPGAPPVHDDPQLTEAGHVRAQCLARMLKDSNITTIITSGVTRTNQTAEPLASTLHLEIKKIPSIPETVATAKQGAAGGNVLIVGHSNTVPEIVKGLSNTTVSVPDDEFDLMFIVTPGSNSNVATMHYCPAGAKP
jgi:phosphohistidine phosphatase SixA